MIIILQIYFSIWFLSCARPFFTLHAIHAALLFAFDFQCGWLDLDCMRRKDCWMGKLCEILGQMMLHIWTHLKWAKKKIVAKTSYFSGWRWRVAAKFAKQKRKNRPNSDEKWFLFSTCLVCTGNGSHSTTVRQQKGYSSRQWFSAKKKLNIKRQTFVLFYDARGKLYLLVFISFRLLHYTCSVAKSASSRMCAFEHIERKRTRTRIRVGIQSLSVGLSVAGSSV